MPWSGARRPREPNRRVPRARHGQLPQVADMIAFEARVGIPEGREIKPRLTKERWGVELLGDQRIRDAGHPERRNGAPIERRERWLAERHVVVPIPGGWPTATAIWPSAPQVQPYLGAAGGLFTTSYGI